jgi:hypothetical protein
MLSDFQVWDYTFSVIAEPDRFHGQDDLPGPVATLPEQAVRTLRPIIPTFLWVATKTPRPPAGPELVSPARQVVGR